MFATEKHVRGGGGRDIFLGAIIIVGVGVSMQSRIGGRAAMRREVLRIPRLPTSEWRRGIGVVTDDVETNKRCGSCGSPSMQT